MKPHLSEYITAPPFIYLSGQLGFHGETMVTGGIASQTRQCLENVVRVLGSLNLGLSDVVKTTVWLRNMEDFGAFDAAYAEAFGSHRPARSTVVSNLVVPDALVEVEVVACDARKERKA